MYIQKKSQKVSSLYPLVLYIFFFISFLKADNVIVNKTVISGGNITANTGIIINGQKIKTQKPLTKDDLKAVTKKIPNKVTKTSIALPDFKLYVKKSKKSTLKLPLFLAKKAVIDNDFIKISDNRNRPVKIEYSLEYLNQLELTGNYFLFYDNDTPIIKISSTGEGTLDIVSKNSKLYLNLVGNYQIKIENNLDLLSINYTGDIDIKMKRVSDLNIQGTGDVKISLVQNPLHFTKDIVGEIEINKRKQ